MCLGMVPSLTLGSLSTFGTLYVAIVAMLTGGLYADSL